MEVASTNPLVLLLKQAAPGLVVQERADPWHGEHARADLPDATSVQFTYLFEKDGGTVLALYPADTLEQARVFYKDDSRVRNTLRLAADGWEIEPNLHFGFMEKGLCWATALPDLRDYTDYWRGRIHTLGKFPREEWPRELDRLEQANMFNANDREQFRRDFADTGRNSASPRPGLRAQRRWQSGESPRVEAVRAALVSGLAALGEHGSLRQVERAPAQHD